MKSQGQRLADRQEKDIAHRIGGCRTPMSGAGDVKNDVRSGDRNLLIECKTVTGSKQITIKANDIEQVMGNALKTGRQGILTFRLHGRDYVIEEWDNWLERYESSTTEEEC